MEVKADSVKYVQKVAKGEIALVVPVSVSDAVTLIPVNVTNVDTIAARFSVKISDSCLERDDLKIEPVTT